MVNLAQSGHCASELPNSTRLLLHPRIHSHSIRRHRSKTNKRNDTFITRSKGHGSGTGESGQAKRLKRLMAMMRSELKSVPSLRAYSPCYDRMRLGEKPSVASQRSSRLYSVKTGTPLSSTRHCRRRHTLHSE